MHGNTTGNSQHWPMYNSFILFNLFFNLIAEQWCEQCQALGVEMLCTVDVNWVVHRAEIKITSPCM